MGERGFDFDVVIIGAGVIGLACAARLAGGRRRLLVLERHARAGQETSSRNSGVIHAGIYYPPGSLKARMCVQGRALLYARCQRYAIPHRRCGKIIVASDEAECAMLRELQARGLENGAGALAWLDAERLRRLEPRVRAVAGLLSPETGIVDAHGLMESYRAEAAAGGAEFAFGVELTACDPEGGGLTLRVREANGEHTCIRARHVVNAAGLSADRVAALAGLDIDALGYRLHPCKGDYFGLASHLCGLVRHLVYPVPGHAGLGVHLTFDLGGQLSAGPDATYVDARDDYAVSPDKASAFGEALRRYVPEVRDADLAPNYAGIRPKLQGPGTPFRDFVIEDAAGHGADGLVNLIGIESPGLTASAAIADEVARML